MTTRIAILVYDGVDVIDAGGPYEVFLTAARLRERDGLEPGLEVRLVSPGGADVVAHGGVTLTGLGDATGVAHDVDVVVVPGTTDLKAVLANAPLASAVRALVDAAPLVTAVCTGAFLLARADAIGGRPVTTHWEDLAELRAEPGVDSVVEGVRWVDSGALVTSGGLTSGIHMALHLVGRWFGAQHAARTARQLDVEWDPSGRSRAED